MRPIYKIVLIPALLTTFLLIIAACQPAMMPSELHKSPMAESYFEINEQGDLLRPSFDFRESWIYIGTPLTPNDLNDGKAPFPEFHNVYIDPASFKSYKESGEFREGTILLKELISVGDKSAPSGNGYFMGDFIGLEATIKSAEHFPDEPGNWAYFSFTNMEEEGGPLADSATAFPTDSCNACHELFAGETDFVFAAYYPVLSSAHPGMQADSATMADDGDDAEGEDMGEATASEEPAASEEPMAETGAGTTVMLSENDTVGKFLVDDAGMTLYLFTEDAPNVSNCDVNCLLIWPPLLTDGEPVAGDGGCGCFASTNDSG